jgi:hypothetical protein
VTWTAVALLALGVLLAEPASRMLAGARWPARDPIGALLLWQAIGLAGGLALLGAGVTYGLAPLGDSLPTALGAVFSTQLHLGTPYLLALSASAALAVRLLSVLGLAAARTLRARRRHRNLLDVLATPWPAMAGAQVLAHPLPFVAWGATAPWVPGMARAQAAVAALVEMRADDVARAHAGRGALAGALRQVGGSAASATLTSFSAALTHRLDRLAHTSTDLPVAQRLVPRLAALTLLAVPTVILLLP